MTTYVPTGKPRGFATMDPVDRREIASRGGKAAQEGGKAHKFTSEEAKAAGQKGGSVRGKGGSGRRVTSKTA